jgi:hypothetical protein
VDADREGRENLLSCSPGKTVMELLKAGGTENASPSNRPDAVARQHGCTRREKQAGVSNPLIVMGFIVRRV